MTEVRRNRYGRPVRNLSYKAKVEFKKSVPNRCNVCGEESDHYEVDHIIPLWEGGDDSFDNLQLICYECHKTKSAQEMHRWNKLNPSILIVDGKRVK